MDRVTAIGAAVCLLVVLGACSTGTATAWTYAPLTQGSMALAVASAETPHAEHAAAATQAVPAQAAAATQATSAAAASPATSAAADAEAAAAGVLEVHAFELGFEPAALTVPAAGRYTVRFVNDGTIFHDITFEDGTVIGAEAGQSAEGEVDVPAGGLVLHLLGARTWPGRHDREHRRRGRRAGRGARRSPLPATLQTTTVGPCPRATWRRTPQPPRPSSIRLPRPRAWRATSTTSTSS